ncbi:MAG: D-alanyl-D-alanine carboxypeptidase/D-alanyl-D-alanine-endopeptidase [Candidatus Zixiibacteriota bacterium]|nr:MAG: D-alanyl-D-alanine carboxypeptidase/D-alanyl-D-alanine-endopeptidase [candidate division Zixibacteria bacterium]
MKTKPIHFAALLALLVMGCSPLLSGRGGDHKRLVQTAEQYMNSVSLRGASWSAMAVDLTDGRILLSQDPQRILIPGSGLKLLTTACALETLGPEFRVSTQIGYSGNLEPGGVIAGDLVIIGGGDPTLSTRFRLPHVPWPAADTVDVCAAWADTLYARGVRQIRGGLVAGNGLFGGESLGSGWEWDDLPAWFAAEFSPLVYKDACVEVTILPSDTVGASARVELSPANDYVTFANHVLSSDPASPSDLNYNRDLGNNVITVWGTVPAGSGPHKRWVSVHDPAGFFLAALEDALIQRGIMILRTPRVTSDSRPAGGDFKLLYTDPSPPLREMIRIINTQSQSLHAEIMIRLLGLHTPNAAAAEIQNPFTAGRERIRQWESAITGPGTGFFMSDGSGLSRRNLLSAQEMIKVLVHMNRSPHRSDFLTSMASPGMGTLKTRFLGLPMDITLRAKTGSLNRIRSVSGYLLKNNQPRIAFSLICNNYFSSAEEVEQTMENVVQLLALYLREE